MVFNILFLCETSMLSNTYVRIVCSNENNSIRELLRQLECWKAELSDTDENGTSISGLVGRIEKGRQARRFEKYILPFLEAENAGNDALNELYKTKKELAVSYAVLRPLLALTTEGRMVDWQILQPEIRRYCELNRRLLELEESRTGVPVQTKVSEDVWFSLAENFIREDKALLENRYSSEKDVFDLISGNAVRKQGVIRVQGII